MSPLHDGGVLRRHLLQAKQEAAAMAAGWLHLAAAAAELSPAQLSYAMAGIAASVLVCCCST